MPLFESAACLNRPEFPVKTTVVNDGFVCFGNRAARTVFFSTNDVEVKEINMSEIPRENKTLLNETLYRFLRMFFRPVKHAVFTLQKKELQKKRSGGAVQHIHSQCQRHFRR